MKQYSIYVHIFPNNKKYIGQTSKNVYIRWGKNGAGYLNNRQNAISNAILKYGWDNIQHIVLCEGLTLEQANYEEMRLIKQLKTSNKNYGYNILKGGLNCKRKPLKNSTKNKIRNKAIIAKTYKNFEKYVNDKKKKVLCIETGIIYESIKEAERQTGISDTTIRLVCLGKRKTSGSYHWKFEL